MKAAIVIAWVTWAFLFLSWPLDLLIVLLQEAGDSPPPDPALATVLGVMGAFLLTLSFALRWFLFRFLIHPKRIPIGSAWTIVAFLGGSLVIWALVKSVEIYGLVLAFISESMALYLAFWTPTLLVMVVHLPFFLDPRRTRKRATEIGGSG